MNTNKPSNNSPPLYDRFLLKQYTYHGDVLINSLLKGTDTIDTYRTNISSEYKLRFISGSDTYVNLFSCLYLGLIPQSKSHENILQILERQDNDIQTYNRLYKYRTISNYHPNYEAYKTLKLQIYKDDQTITRIYDTEIYPSIKERLDASDLDYFRIMTYYIIQQLYITIKNTPPLIENPFVVYRRVNNFYLNKDPNTISKFTSFHSTTKGSPDSRAIKRFGQLLYTFIVHPECQYISMIPYSYKPEEDEIVFTPGNRYVFLSEETERPSPGTKPTPVHMTYVILPPEEGYTLPETYEEYRAYLQTIQAEQNLTEQNQTSLAIVRDAIGGGHTIKSRTIRKIYKRSMRKRMTRRYKQRGGTVLEPEPNGSRWETPSNQPMEVNKLTRNDKQMIQNML